MIKTKIVATVGPGCNSEAVLAGMIDAGVNVFRLNFSHGSLDDHAEAVRRIRLLAGKKRAFVAIMGDLCGPKIRLGEIADGKCELREGQTVLIQRQPVLGTPDRVSTNYPALIDEVREGHRVLIDDGNVLLRVQEKQPDAVVCLCEVAGTISDRKGINLPDSRLSTPTLTEKDRRDLQWAMENDLDFIALSFVRRPEDLEQLHDILKGYQSDMKVVSKIEKPEAIEQLEKIIALSDVVLVARGDLGVEMEVCRVPLIQKEITLLCRRQGKPVIIATQMLQSMVDAPVPTRAEVSDVANAILDSTDAVMLSAETSVGKYPLAAVRMIRKIAEQTESFGQHYGDELGASGTSLFPVAKAVVRAAALVAADLNVPAVALWTDHGDSPRLLCKLRLTQPIAAFTADERVCRQMAILYGVFPVHRPQVLGLHSFMEQAD
ncbi:MAG: pyruvate kinase, partial [Phycisphaerales bacterium]|nr:pyruvate kinase [Phycisphaerales bacterium]